MKNKKPLIITAVAIDLVLTLGLLILSIVMLANIVGKNADQVNHLTGLIGYFAKNPNVYGFTCVLPLFLLLAINIVVLVLYVKKQTRKEPVKVDDLTEEQKEALRQELLKELAGK